MPIVKNRKEEQELKVTFNNGLLFLQRPDKKPVAFPIEWFPKLMNATEAELADWEQTDKGIHFNQLDEDVSF